MARTLSGWEKSGGEVETSLFVVDILLTWGIAGCMMWFQRGASLPFKWRSSWERTDVS